MRFRENIKKAFTKSFVIEGRASRNEFWSFTLFNIFVLIMILCFVLVLRLASFWILIPLYLLAVLFPWISVLIRRIHDTEKSCLDLMLIVIPILGPIVVMIWLCSDSQPGSNKYGLNPKENQISIQSKSIIRS